MKFSSVLFKGPYKLVGIGISVLYFLLVLWVWISKGAGNFILLFDRSARHALRRNEKLEAIAVGGGLCCGALLFAAGVWLSLVGPVVVGAALVAATFPFSMTFTNESRIGRVVFGSIAALTLVTSLILTALSFFPDASATPALQFFAIGLVACLACTFLGNFPALRR
jgi:hypothetical protein